MTTRVLLSAVFVAVAFAAWPLIGRASKASGPWLSVLVMCGSALIVAAMAAPQLVSPPGGRALGLIALAALANGAAVFVYASRAADPAVPTGAFLVTVSVLQVTFVPLIVWLMPGGQMPTMRQAAGFVCAAAAVYLLARG
jgi:hypothetical protein